MNPLELLTKLFLEQSELLVNFPQGMLPPERIDELKKIPGLAIAEVAGRDSIAAAIKLYREGFVQKILPTVVYNGVQYGSFSEVLQAVKMLRNHIGDENVAELVVLGSPRFSQALNFRFTGHLNELFGFYTPCITCHLYFHAVRVPLAIRLGCGFVISGERESHDGRIKINQTSTVLDRYVEFLTHFGIDLLQPLRRISSGAEVERLLGCDWKEGENQLNCLLSSNYRRPDGSVDFGPGCRFSDEKSVRLLDEFAIPTTQAILTKLLRGEKVNYELEAVRILSHLTK